MYPVIKVVGAGGSGSNTVSRISHLGLPSVELIAFNTDSQALRLTKADKKILIGRNTTKGLGTGMDVALGRKAAEEQKKEIEESLKGADMIFITCGLGGGTGSGATPVIAEVAKNLGILTIAVITTPFSFEGIERRRISNDVLKALEDKVDSLLVVSNDNLLKVIDQKTTVSNAFELCDQVLSEAVKGISDLILNPGIINIDFASVLSLIKDSGRALFGTGKAVGENRIENAAKSAINSPLLDFSIKGSKGVLFNVIGQDVSLVEVQKAAEVITKEVDPKSQIIFGTTKDRSLQKGEVKIIVIATKL